MLYKNTVQLIACLLLSLHLPAQPSKGYQVKLFLPGLVPGEKIQVSALDAYGQSLKTAEYIVTKNSELIINDEVNDGPVEFDFQFIQHPNWALDLAIKNGDSIVVSASPDQLKTERVNLSFASVIQGSPLSLSAYSLRSAYYMWEEGVMDIKKSIVRFVDSAGFNGPKITQMFEDINTLNKTFGHEFFSTSYPYSQSNREHRIAYPLFAHQAIEDSHHAPFLITGYNDLSAEMKNSYYGKFLKNELKLCVGQPFPTFTLPSSNGSQLALKDVVKKNKLTLIHFWEGQSYMKQRLQEELKIFYPKYHDKGFEIVGFYTGPYKTKFDELITREKYPWLNVSDFKGEEGMAAGVYNEYIRPGQTIPNTTNVLIDQEGKIVAWDLYGPELQMYLWQNFDR